MPGDVGATIRTWGLGADDPCNQYLGSVPLRPGLALAFPNIYQHRITYMSLGNPRRPGNLTLLSLFLVDPDITPITSTSSIIPQNYRWIHQAVEKYIDPRLPIEVVVLILSYVDSSPTDEEVDGHERDIRIERKAFRLLLDDHYFSLLFDPWNTNANAQ